MLYVSRSSSYNRCSFFPSCLFKPHGLPVEKPPTQSESNRRTVTVTLPFYTTEPCGSIGTALVWCDAASRLQHTVAIRRVGRPSLVYIQCRHFRPDTTAGSTPHWRVVTGRRTDTCQRTATARPVLLGCTCLLHTYIRTYVCMCMHLFLLRYTDTYIRYT